MADIRDFKESAIRNDDETGPMAGRSPQAQSSAEKGRYFAYNQTRERFLSTDVEAADFSTSSLEDRLSTFRSGTGAALWITPFRGLSPTSVRFPIDLIYLDESCIVLGAVESFPLSMVDTSVPLAASVLAIPARAIASAGILAGDQLILSTSEEMKRHLTSRTERKTQEVTSQGLQFEDRPQPPSPESTPTRGPDPQESASQAQPTDPKPEPSAKKPKNWWQRLLSDDPPDPREAPREALPGLVAYFFTGGNPVGHGVRDISATGMYVFTSERWYLGTLVRITLTDQREPTIERSMTLNAKAVRWGNDGVGLQFVLHPPKRSPRSKPLAQADPKEGVGIEQLKTFLQRYRDHSLVG